MARNPPEAIVVSENTPLFDVRTVWAGGAGASEHTELGREAVRTDAQDSRVFATRGRDRDAVMIAKLCPECWSGRTIIPSLPLFLAKWRLSPCRTSAAAIIVRHVSAPEGDAEYAVKRLVRGACSSRASARQGFASCLAEVLKALPTDAVRGHTPWRSPARL